VRIWDREWKLAKKEKRLASFLFPMIIPMIVHQGERKFTSPTEMLELVDVVPGLKHLVLNMRAILFDITPLKKEEFPNEIILYIFLTFAQAAFRKDCSEIIQKLIDFLKPHLPNSEIVKELEDCLHYMLTSGKYYTQEDHKQFTEELKNIGVEIMSPSALDMLVEEIEEKANIRANIRIEEIEEKANIRFEEGFETGFENGFENGFEKSAIQHEVKSILRTLTKRFKKVPKRIEKSLMSIADLEQLEKLADFAYDCETLGEFEKALK
jgi:hypothetical protein